MDHLNLLKNLVKIKSYSGEEEGLRKYIAKWFKERGINKFVQSENLIVHIKGKDRSRAFIFNSHLDTVSKGDLKWKYGPWNPTLVKTKVVGLGVSDTKSGIASSMLLAEKMANSGKPPIDMWFTYVVREEQDGTGTKNFAKWFSKEGYPGKYKSMAAIFTEPTGLIEVEHGHRGNLFLKVTSKGDSGHGARPDLIKRHAVREMIKFADELQLQFKEWRKEFSSNKFEPPTVGEMTSIQAGVAIKKEYNKLSVEVESPNKFPSTCIATFDIRTTPDFHKVAFNRISRLGKKMGVKIKNAYPPSPAGYTDPKEKIVKCSQKVLKGAKLTVSKGAADLGFLTELGVKSIILGPGEKEQAHKTNEYVYFAQISKAVELYEQIVDAWTK